MVDVHAESRPDASEGCTVRRWLACETRGSRVAQGKARRCSSSPSLRHRHIPYQDSPCRLPVRATCLFFFDCALLSDHHYPTLCETQHTTPRQPPTTSCQSPLAPYLTQVYSTPAQAWRQPTTAKRHCNRPCRRPREREQLGLHQRQPGLDYTTVWARRPSIPHCIQARRSSSLTTTSHRTWRKCHSTMARRRWQPRIVLRTPSQALCPPDESTLEDRVAVYHGSRQRRRNNISRML
jgi:hypothetical protein